MDTAIIEQTTVAEEAVTQVLRWRFQQLCRAGFEPEDATVLATNTAVDLHRALDLVQRGCPPTLRVQEGIDVAVIVNALRALRG